MKLGRSWWTVAAVQTKRLRNGNTVFNWFNPLFWCRQGKNDRNTGHGATWKKILGFFGILPDVLLFYDYSRWKRSNLKRRYSAEYVIQATILRCLSNFLRWCASKLWFKTFRRNAYSFSHNHGSGNWPYLKGNCSWIDLFITSMFMGGRVLIICWCWFMTFGWLCWLLGE